MYGMLSAAMKKRVMKDLEDDYQYRREQAEGGRMNYAEKVEHLRRRLEVGIDSQETYERNREALAAARAETFAARTDSYLHWGEEAAYHAEVDRMIEIENEFYDEFGWMPGKKGVL